MARPIFPWPGGKRRLAQRIIAMLPESHTCYVEAFAGGGAVLFEKEPSQVEVLNDINGDVVNLYRVCKHHLDELVRHLRWSLVSRQMFEWESITDASTLTDVQRAARFYYLQRTGFGGKCTGRTFGYSATRPPGLDITRVGEDLSQAHLRLAKVQIEALPWADCVERYDRPGTVFFLDPPYYQTAGYGVPFEEAEYDRLAAFMGGLKGRAILTINDHPKMAKLFARFKPQKVAISYTIGAGAKAARELICRTW